MLSYIYAILSLCCAITSHGQDGEWMHCKAKQGCSIAKCDPRPIGWLVKQDPEEYPILCRQTGTPSQSNAETSANTMNGIQKKNSALEKRLRILELKWEVFDDSSFPTNSDIKTFENTINELQAQVKGLQFQVKANAKNVINAIKVTCPVTFGTSCFVPVLDRKVSYDDGAAICKNIGGSLANIYSQSLLDNIMNYMRKYRFGDEKNMWIRTGMKYEPLYGTLRLRDGTNSAVLKWYPDYPKIGPIHLSETSVMFGVQADQESQYQYLYHHKLSREYHVLCEIE